MMDRIRWYCSLLCCPSRVMLARTAWSMQAYESEGSRLSRANSDAKAAEGDSEREAEKMPSEMFDTRSMGAGR